MRAAVTERRLSCRRLGGGAATFLSPSRGGKGGRLVPPVQSGAGDKKVATPSRPSCARLRDGGIW